MARVAIDANVLIDYKNAAAGERNERATEIVRALDRGEIPTAYVPEHALAETLNWLHVHEGHDVAVDLRWRLHESAGFEIEPSTTADLQTAFERFETYDVLSFGDAAIVAFLERTGVEYLYSFDDDFDAVEGVTRLSSAHHPERD